MKQEKPTNLFMSEETRKEFRAILRDLDTSDVGTPYVYEAMKAAHNAAVLKCAESAGVKYDPETFNIKGITVDRDSILKLLIP